jgi:hypothetical protein
MHISKVGSRAGKLTSANSFGSKYPLRSTSARKKWDRIRSSSSDADSLEMSARAFPSPAEAAESLAAELCK